MHWTLILRATDHGDVAKPIGEKCMCEAHEKCDACRSTRNDLRERKWFGCARCYVVFASELPGLLGSESRSETELSPPPSSVPVIRRKLQEELSRVVALEEYEQAAEIRDRLRQLPNE